MGRAEPALHDHQQLLEIRAVGASSRQSSLSRCVAISLSRLLPHWSSLTCQEVNGIGAGGGGQCTANKNFKEAHWTVKNIEGCTCHCIGQHRFDIWYLHSQTKRHNIGDLMNVCVLNVPHWAEFCQKTVLADESSILSISNPGELFQTLSQLSQLWPSKLLPSVELSKWSSHWWWHTTFLSTSTQNS